MKKSEFLDQLRSKLSGLPPEDINERLSFYSEMIDDRIEDGVPEDEAVNDIGSVEEVVNTILAEYPLSKLVKNKVKPKKQMPVWAIVLLIIGFPMWFPILISIFSVVFSIYITVWAVLVSFFISSVALVVSGVACLIAAVYCLTQANFLGAVSSVGAGLVVAGLGVLWFIGNIYLVKGVAILTKKIVIGIKSLFVGKEG